MINSNYKTTASLKSIILFSVLILSFSFSRAQIIFTVAGNGTSGYNGDGIPATAASFGDPYIVATDNAGNLYISDGQQIRVRKVTMSTGLISTVAGNGTWGFSGDGGPATAAEISPPSGIFVDNAGDVYFVDQQNSRIREVNTSGIINTVAGNGVNGFSGDGGPATAAEFSDPTGIVLDSYGNMYIADNNNDDVRVINANSGIITEYAGIVGHGGYSGNGGPATAAEISGEQLAIDGSNNLYIASGFGIQEVNFNTHIITGVAGIGVYGFSGMGGPATAAEFEYSYGVAVDNNGNIFIPAQGDQSVLKVNTSGIINVFAGNGTQGFSGDGGPATAAETNNIYGACVDKYGNVYIADQSNHRIRVVGFGAIASVNSNATCYGSPTGSATVTTIGVGQMPYTYLWSPGGYSTATVSSLSGGTYTIQVTDAIGRVAYSNVTISQNPFLGVTISSQTNQTCTSGGSITAALTNIGLSKTFSYEPAVQNFTVPAGVTSITATIEGAIGAANGNSSGGKGAVYNAICTVTPGDVLSIVSGGKGGAPSGYNGGGGGGGSFLYDSTTGTLLLVAGGGGGASYFNNGGGGGTSVISPYPTTNGAGGNGSGGTSGLGGIAGSLQGSYGGGAGGAGWLGNGTGNGTSPYNSTGGFDHSNQFAGGNAITGDVNSGGYGGGGGGGTAGGPPFCGGGGGGGYNGAGGGNNSSKGGGGGGGSYINATYVTLVGSVTATNSGNGSVTLQYIGAGGVPPYSYTWSPSGGTALTASNLSVGTYTITVTDANSCTATTSTTITGGGVSISSVTSTGACNGSNNGSANAVVTGGTLPYTYSWSNGTTNIVSTSNPTGTILSAGSYTVSVTDANNCNATATVNIAQSLAIIPTWSKIVNVSCYGGSNGRAVSMASGGIPPYTYIWSPNVSTNSSAVNLSANIPYTLTVEDNNGCSGTISITLTQPAAALHETITKNSDLTCHVLPPLNYANGSATSNPTGGTSPYTFSWVPSGGTLQTSVTLPAGTITCLVTDAHGCLSTATVSLTQPTVVYATFTKNLPYCTGNSNGSITAVGVGGSGSYTNYTWAPYGGSNATASGLSAQTYTVTVTDNTGCLGTASTVLGQPAPIAVTISGPTCTGNSGKGTVVANATGGTPGYNYTWSNGITTVGTAQRETFVNGSYTVTVGDRHNCAKATATIDFRLCPTTLREGADVKGDDNNGLSELTVYPNPTNGQFTISGLEQGQIIEMYDYTGRKISTISVSCINMQLNISDQPNGVYLIRILDKNGIPVSEKKVVKTQ